VADARRQFDEVEGGEHTAVCTSWRGCSRSVVDVFMRLVGDARKRSHISEAQSQGEGITVGRLDIAFMNVV
jgi:hypothetical protein